QLIAFFMMVINFDQTQADERVKLPRSELARPPQTARAEKRVLNVGYIRDKKGNKQGPPYVWLPGMTRRDVNKDDPRWPNGYAWPGDEKAFASDLMKIKCSLHRDEKLAETTIVIRADGDGPGGITTDLVNICQQPAQCSGEKVTGFVKFEFSAAQKVRTNKRTN
ncbi:MAG: hypothetical protein ACE5KM_21100, partial [Planctomycetaceae bacterium]